MISIHAYIIGELSGNVTMVMMMVVLALVVAVPIGMGLAYLFNVAVNQFLNLDMLNFHLPLPIFLMQLTVALLVPVVASLIPVMGGVRVTVREAISNYGIEGIRWPRADRPPAAAGARPATTGTAFPA